MDNTFLTVKQASEKFPSFTQSSLRYLAFNKDRNGFSKVIRKIGRKVLISENDFLNWINTNGGQS